jgi:GNAT superfamily N-acetyltransferase
VEPLAPRPLRGNDLTTIEPWFDDPETQRWLGGRDWPSRLAQLAEQPGRFALLYARGEEPVALLDIERYDDGTAAVAVVVSPRHRRQGIAASILGSIFDLPEVAGVEEVFGEVEQGDTAGERLVCAAGLVPEARATTDEGFDRFVVRRRPQ